MSDYSTRPIINYQATMNRLMKHIARWNAQAPLHKQVRWKYGEGGSHSQTARNILNDYIEKYPKRRAFGERLKVTRTWLAKLFCTPRTIYNHLERLVQAGIIIQKNFSYEDFANGKGFINCLFLSINPALIVYENPPAGQAPPEEPKPIAEVIHNFSRRFTIVSLDG
jgi:hypothetical protein